MSPTEYGPWGAFTKGVIMVMVTARGTAGASVEVGPIDPKLLKDQLQELIELIWDDGDNILWGIVYMLEDIADEIEMDRINNERT